MMFHPRFVQLCKYTLEECINNNLVPVRVNNSYAEWRTVRLLSGGDESLDIAHGHWLLGVAVGACGQVDLFPYYVQRGWEPGR